MLDGVKEVRVTDQGERVPKDDHSVACESVLPYSDALHTLLLKSAI